MDNDGKEVLPEGEVKSQEATPEVQTPTAEEQLKTLGAKLQEIETARNQSEERYKGLQRTVNQKDEEIKKQANFDSRISAINERIELLATAIASGRTSEEEASALPEKDKTNILDNLKRIKANEEAKKQQDDFMHKVRSFQSRTEALGLTEKDDKYVEIQELVETGRLRMADITLRKLETEKEKVVTDEKKPESKKETDEEIYLRMAKAKGLLKTDNTVPSGGGLTAEKVREDYAHGRTTTEKYTEQCKSLGIPPV